MKRIHVDDAKRITHTYSHAVIGEWMWILPAEVVSWVNGKHHAGFWTTRSL